MLKRVRKILILALAVCMVWGMSVTVMAATSNGSGETSDFTFSNEGTTDSNGTNPNSGTGGTGGTTGSTGGTTGTTGSGGSGNGSGSSGTSGAKTADANTGAYATTAAIAGAGVAALLGMSINRRRRYGEEERS